MLALPLLNSKLEQEPQIIYENEQKKNWLVWFFILLLFFIYFVVLFCIRLFTVLYFPVRWSRSRALSYGLPSSISVKIT